MADRMIPTRVSVDDEDFDPSLIPLIVKLNGVEIDKVVAYDMDAGTVRHCVTDERGNLVVDPVADEIVTVTTHGVVTVDRG